MKKIIIVCIPLIVLFVLKKKGLIPELISNYLLAITIVIGSIYVVRDIWEIHTRSNMNFDEYDWRGLSDIGVESTGNAGFDITAFDNIGTGDEITLKFSGTDSNMIDTKVKKLKNSKNILSDLSMLGNNIHVDIVTSELDDVEDELSNIKDRLGGAFGRSSE